MSVKKFGKISARPHTTQCIQFLNRENNKKKKYIASGKTDLFYNSMGLCGNFTKNFLKSCDNTLYFLLIK